MGRSVSKRVFLKISIPRVCKLLFPAAGPVIPRDVPRDIISLPESSTSVTTSHKRTGKQTNKHQLPTNRKTYHLKSSKRQGDQCLSITQSKVDTSRTTRHISWLTFKPDLCEVDTKFQKLTLPTPTRSKWQAIELG